MPSPGGWSLPSADTPHGFQRGARRRDIDSKRLEELLRQVQQGRLEVGEALNRLRALPYEDLGFAKLDHHRDLRTGFPEVVYAPGKTLEQLTRIARSMAESSSRVLITRAGTGGVCGRQRGAARGQLQPIGQGHSGETGRAGPSDARRAHSGRRHRRPAGGGRSGRDRGANGQRRGTAVGRGGGGDSSTAGASASIAGGQGCGGRGRDGGRPAERRSAGWCLRRSSPCPPAWGTGPASRGLPPCLSMLNACSPGIAVVNIDNGFGAGYMAGMINLSSPPGAPA